MNSFEATRPSLKKATPCIFTSVTDCPSMLGASRLFTSIDLTTSLNSRTCSPAVAACPKAQASTVKTTAARVCVDIFGSLCADRSTRSRRSAPRFDATASILRFDTRSNQIDPSAPATTVRQIEGPVPAGPIVFQQNWPSADGLFDHSVSAQEHRLRHRDTELARSLQIHYDLDLGRLFDRKVSGLRTF